MSQEMEFIKTVLSQKRYALVAASASVAFFSVFLYFTDFSLMVGNMGITHTIVVASLSVIAAILFGVYVSIFLFRRKETKTFSSGALGVAGTGASLLVTGCAACGITLASYLGLSALVVGLPFFGLEFNVLGIILLFFSVRNLARATSVCKVPP